MTVKRAVFENEGNVVIRTYQGQHGGTIFYAAPSRRQKTMRTRLMALVVIAAVAASAGVVQAFSTHTSMSVLAPGYTTP
jgi:hypothetical protein